MSKIGKLPIKIPEGATVNIADNIVTVKSQKGELIVPVLEGVALKLEDGSLKLELKKSTKQLINYLPKGKH